MIYDFQKKAEVAELVTSRAKESIPAILDGCVSVDRSTRSEDISGVDLWAVLRGGHRVGIDVKSREPGCSKFWSGPPELALEVWSKMPDNFNRGVAGWTLSEKKRTEWVFYCWDSADSSLELLLPFQSLRVALRRNLDAWKEEFTAKPQANNGWTSFAIFVPWPVVFRAMCEVSFYISPESDEASDSSEQDPIVAETVAYMQEHYDDKTSTFDDSEATAGI